MHGMPCSALDQCFGSDPPSDVPGDQRPSPGPEDSSSQGSRTDPGGPGPAGASPVQSQPGAHLPGEGERLGTPRTSAVSWGSEEDLPGDGGPLLAPRYPLIPRPSIIIRQPGRVTSLKLEHSEALPLPQSISLISGGKCTASYRESEGQETAADRWELQEVGDGRLSGLAEAGGRPCLVLVICWWKMGLFLESWIAEQVLMLI
ncbi:unnamed protein product [Arctogadus glacialis]